MPRAARPFESLVDSSGECWIWLGHKNADGYGTLRFRGRMQYAHRVAWILANGEILDGLHVCHRCDNPSYVRPQHLFLGTNQDNVQDRHSKGRTKNLEAGRAKRHRVLRSVTHCPQGREYSESNTLYRKNGSRKCRECGRQGTCRYLERNREDHNARRRVARAAKRKAAQ